jgi:hypothetical protein
MTSVAVKWRTNRRTINVHAVEVMGHESRIRRFVISVESPDRFDHVFGELQPVVMSIDVGGR